MPRFPHFADRTTRIGGSVFEQFRAKMSARGSDMMGLHIGDAYLPPPYALPVHPAFVVSNPGFNRYCDTFGVPALRDALGQKLATDNRMPATRDAVLVTAGATNALSSIFQAIINDGDEVIFLAPYWPFARGMVHMAGGNVVEVPFYTECNDAAGAGGDARALIASRITDRTVAMYVNSPNNPSGQVLSRAQLQAVADAARAHDLWLVSDEAYDGMAFDGRDAHLSPGAFDGMFERTLSVFTFSKTFMFAGLRLGYVACGSADAIRTVNKCMVHQLYSPSTLAQEMMVAPVRERAAWSGAFVEECEAMRDRVRDALGLDIPQPGGAYYHFFDATPYLRGRTSAQIIEACLDADVAVAPGADFGAAYASWIRLCFAGVPPDHVMRGVERLRGVLG